MPSIQAETWEVPSVPSQAASVTLIDLSPSQGCFNPEETTLYEKHPRPCSQPATCQRRGRCSIKQGLLHSNRNANISLLLCYFRKSVHLYESDWLWLSGCRTRVTNQALTIANPHNRYWMKRHNIAELKKQSGVTSRQNGGYLPHVD